MQYDYAIPLLSGKNKEEYDCNKDEQWNKRQVKFSMQIVSPPPML